MISFHRLIALPKYVAKINWIVYLLQIDRQGKPNRKWEFRKIWMNEEIIVINYQIKSQSLPCVQNVHVKLERMPAQCHSLEWVHSSDCLFNWNALQTKHAQFFSFGPFNARNGKECVRESDEGGMRNKQWPICSDELFFSCYHMQVIPAKCNFSTSLTLRQIQSFGRSFLFQHKKTKFWRKSEKREPFVMPTRESIELKLRILL